MRTFRRLLAALAGVVLVAGCATVPEESQPVAVQQQELGEIANPDVQQPARDLDPLTVARDFVRASAQPVSNNAAARMYLDDGAAKAWQPGKVMNVIDDQFNTVYATGVDLPANPNERVVVVRGTNLGMLGGDSSFIPSKSPYELRLLVRKQSDGQWRVTNPPANIVVPYSDFTANYVRVPVYFFAQDSNTIVPDLRYVAGKPQLGLPARVVSLLLSGPSDQLVGAVRTPLPEDANIEGNVTVTPDGALMVPLTGVADQTPEVKKLIAAQIVLSLQAVTTNRVRLLSDGNALVDGHEDWLPSDVPSYTSMASPGADLPGLMTVNGRIRSLADGALIQGPAGQGAYQVVSAAQSIDGRQLAIVDNADGRQQLRIGSFGSSAQLVNLFGGTLTRPTWRPTATADGTAGEVWTVVDGSAVVRVLRTSDGGWTGQAVNAEEVLGVGPISVLRLSRDGARAAIVVNGQLLVASVVRTQDSVTLRSPRILQTGTLTGVVDVDWLSQDSLVAATTMPSQPVVKVPIDGLRLDTFNSSNLTPPVYAITAAPGRPIVVADAGGLWTASDVGEVWRPHQSSLGARAAPFYPG
ncbi:Lipoprotein LpqB beta-propeller domain-containing protein [Amycolatopsis sacchari]|uniref:Lipoprotein LpqB beta-propeller domain-containing protein n=1 Tax=Amycolatopsis sacchari TaxID=115433 RepID=A0A1I3ZXY9_9PSEU|nr:LpqB family beta-propeller domain-containing protein [Amycolatopsis sacchari]SFK48938.1 Lipoprotein LpqB beta-propeller domain-containing protein [Amycolatopsis sacchari]